jgi:hypothetical protein
MAIVRINYRLCYAHASKQLAFSEVSVNSYISKMYFSHWKPPGASERMWSVNLDGSISGEN